MTKGEMNKNVAGNTIVDRILMGVAAFGLVTGTFLKVLDFVKATEPLNYVLAGGAVVMLLYLLLMPMFRK